MQRGIRSVNRRFGGSTDASPVFAGQHHEFHIVIHTATLPLRRGLSRRMPPTGSRHAQRQTADAPPPRTGVRWTRQKWGLLHKHVTDGVRPPG